MRSRLCPGLSLVVSAVCATACTSPAEPIAADGAYDTAVARCADDQHDRAMDALEVALGSDADACQRALLDPAFTDLRDTDAFRESVHRAAIQHAISSLTLAPPDEPGEWIAIAGRAVRVDDDSPVPGVVVRVFATDEQGRYHPEIEGERLPRLFATLVTDDDGRFAFQTVRPGPYPGTRNARHIHISARGAGLRLAAPQYAVFDDDPLLDEPHNSEQRGEAIRIAMEPPGDDAIAHGTITLPMR